MVLYCHVLSVYGDLIRLQKKQIPINAGFLVGDQQEYCHGYMKHQQGVDCYIFDFCYGNPLYCRDEKGRKNVWNLDRLTNSMAGKYGMLGATLKPGNGLLGARCM